MAPKKQNQQPVKQIQTFVALRDDKTSRHHVVPRDCLSFSKKDNLKVGSSATFNGGGDRSHSFHGTVLICGSKEQCEKCILLIEKSNNSNNNNREEFEDDESNPRKKLTIDESAQKSDDDRNDSEESEDENEVSRKESKSRQNEAQTIKNNNSTMSTITVSNNTCTASNLQLTKVSSHPTVLQQLDNNTDTVPKESEISNESTSSTQKVKRSGTCYTAEFVKLKRENKRLKKENEMYKSNWMPRPSGAAANYIIDIGKILSGTTVADDKEDKGEKLISICDALSMTEKELISCEHKSDITKTCRQIVKFIYPDPKERAEKLVSTMTAGQLEAIQEYARMIHPAQAKTPNSVLNNAIGNVFATEKRKIERKQAISGTSNEASEGSEVDEDVQE